MTLLRGLRVLDLTMWCPGAYATQLLAQFGAEVAECAVSANDRDDAAVRPRHASQICESLGARPLREEIGACARRAQITLGSSAGDSPLRLTPRELEVVRLVADGHSNREIADRSLMTERVRDRHDAAAAQWRIGRAGRSRRLSLRHPKPRVAWAS